MEEDKDRERKAMEREISDLRGQLSRAISASSEAEELRRGIERSERQRAQLSDHIEVGEIEFSKIENHSERECCCLCCSHFNSI